MGLFAVGPNIAQGSVASDLGGRQIQPISGAGGSGLAGKAPSLSLSGKAEQELGNLQLKARSGQGRRGVALSNPGGPSPTGLRARALVGQGGAGVDARALLAGQVLSGGGVPNIAGAGRAGVDARPLLAGQGSSGVGVPSLAGAGGAGIDVRALLAGLRPNGVGVAGAGQAGVDARAFLAGQGRSGVGAPNLVGQGKVGLDTPGLLIEQESKPIKVPNVISPINPLVIPNIGPVQIKSPLPIKDKPLWGSPFKGPPPIKSPNLPLKESPVG